MHIRGRQRQLDRRERDARAARPTTFATEPAASASAAASSTRAGRRAAAQIATTSAATALAEGSVGAGATRHTEVASDGDAARTARGRCRNSVRAWVPLFAISSIDPAIPGGQSVVWATALPVWIAKSVLPR